MAIIQGYDGTRHTPTREVASNVKLRGHKKEEIFAQRLGDIKYVVRGQQKPDVIKGNARYSIKGAANNIQLLLSSLNRSKVVYGVDSPMYQYQLAAYHHKYFKYTNDNKVDTDLFDAFYNAGMKVADWLRDRNNFRFVLENVFSNNYDANKLVILEDSNYDAFVYDMKDVIDLYVNSDYKIHVTEGAKISVRAEEKEIFYLENRGREKCGSMNHGVRSAGLYPFLKENLNPEIIPA